MLGSRETIVVWHDETHLSIGVGDHGPIPPDLRDALVEVMAYTSMRKARRDEAYDPVTGDYRKYVFESVDMHAIEEGGRLACPSGFLPRAVRTARELGYGVDARHVKFDGYPDARPGALRPDWANLFRRFDPRYRQDELLASLTCNLYGRFDVGTGVGKTYCAGAAGLLFPDAEIAFVVPSEGVFQTAYAHFLELLPASEVGRYGRGHRDRKRVTIYMVHSLPRVALEARPDLVLVDECHEMVTDLRVDAITTLARRARLFGFSASMHERFDNHHHRLEAVFGPIIFTLDAIEAVEHGLTVPIRVVWHDVRLRGDPARGFKDEVAIKRHGIWLNSPRNDLIADVARSYGDDEQVLILVETVEHALQLALRLPDYLVCARGVSGRLEEGYVDAGIVDASRLRISNREREAVMTAFKRGEVKKLIGNDTLGRGFSPEALSVLIRGDARRSSIKSTQLPGRVCRVHEASGKAFGRVHDFVDQFSDYFHGVAQDRRLDYAREGFEQVRASDGSVIPVRIRKRR